MSIEPNINDLFPDRISAPPDSFKEKFVRLAQTAYANSSDHFSLAVPRGWDAVDEAGPLGASRFFNWLLHVRPSGEQLARVEVAQALMTHEVNASDWVKIAIDAVGEKILAFKEFSSPVGTLPDVLSKTEDGQQLRRTLGMRDGKKIWLASFQLPAEQFESRAEEVLFSLASFKLLQPAGNMLIEDLETFRSFEGIRAQFSHPTSWSPRVTREAPSRLRVSLEKKLDGRIAGTILIRAWSIDGEEERSPASILNEHRRSLAHKGLSPNQAPWSIVETQELGDLWIADTKGFFGGKDLALTTILIKAADAWVLLGLVSADRNSDPQWWAINRRTFEIVQQSLQMNSK